MKKKLYSNLTLLTLFISLRLFASSPFTVLPGSIQFPKSIHNVPQVCIYQGGERFSCEQDTASKRVCFTLPVDKLCTKFYLLITESLEYKSEDNTVQHLKINPEQSYKFYMLTLKRAPRKRYRLPTQKNEPQKKEEDTWTVTQKEINKNGKLPDEAIIMLLNPDYVASLKADNGFEFPTVVIRHDVLTVAGSEKKLQDNAIELMLSSLDYNPLHSSFKFDTKQDKEKILVAMSGV